MTDDVQIKAWEVLTCLNGHPMYIVVCPIKRDDPLSEPFRGVSLQEGLGVGWDKSWGCQKCDARSHRYMGGHKFIFYVKGKERR